MYDRLHSFRAHPALGVCHGAGPKLNDNPSRRVQLVARFAFPFLAAIPPPLTPNLPFLHPPASPFSRPPSRLLAPPPPLNFRLSSPENVTSTAWGYCFRQPLHYFVVHQSPASLS